MIINGWKLYNNSNINLNFIDNKIAYKPLVK